ncbi:hypothetical protein [Aminirod propionatiphilus]|uniref:Uncharacterized protein n=1 Tax=Aminirod propionatiphilus TaxID=3415223 RepID=A0ACD1DVS6_9BACT|nr:hypothetical protein KIH16_13895 [Synergistota bacterium]
MRLCRLGACLVSALFGLVPFLCGAAPLVRGLGGALAVVALLALALSSFRLWSLVALLAIIEGGALVVVGAGRSNLLPALFWGIGLWLLLEMAYLGCWADGSLPTGMGKDIAVDFLKRLLFVVAPISLLLPFLGSGRASGAPPGLLDALLYLLGAAGAGGALKGLALLADSAVAGGPGEEHEKER